VWRRCWDRLERTHDTNVNQSLASFSPELCDSATIRGQNRALKNITAERMEWRDHPGKKTRLKSSPGSKKKTNHPVRSESL